MTLQKSDSQLLTMLVDDSVPLPHRVQMLGRICLDDNEMGQRLVGPLLKAGKTPKVSKSLHAKKAKELSELMEQLMEGPLRTATYLRTLKGKNGVQRAHVVLDDGSSALVVIPEKKLAKTLRRGDLVILEAQGKAVLYRDEVLPDVGEEAEFLRRLDGERVEVSLRDREPHVLRLSADLMERIDAGQVRPGQKLLVCTRRSLAFDAIPELDGFAHFRFLSRDPVPEILTDRDLACPPEYITRVVESARIQLERPDLFSAYGLRRCVTTLLEGVSGTGKSFSILAVWRSLYELYSEATGVPIEELPPRVFHLRMSDVLSKWLGEAEQNLERFFDEVESLAQQPFVKPDGSTLTLPVLVVLEEIDGLARSRGSGEPILDRILTTALRRLDTSRPDLRDKSIFFVATTNVAGQVDPAFLRRVGGTVERFGRLGRSAFSAVLRTHLEARPLAAEEDETHDETLDRTAAGLTAWIYGEREADPGQVELQYAGASTPERRYRRDFLTASVVDRAVQEAAAVACRVSYAGDAAGITLGQLLDAFDGQIAAIVDQLEPSNVGDYLDLPDGVRVATVRRTPRPRLSPHQLERVA